MSLDKANGEDRRLLLVKADKIRKGFTKMTPEMRASHEAEIIKYIEELRRWEDGRGLYPLTPSFLSNKSDELRSTSIRGKPASEEMRSLHKAMNTGNQRAAEMEADSFLKMRRDLDAMCKLAADRGQIQLIETLTAARAEVEKLL